MRKFCIVTTFRTGSELLVDLLNDHPKIRCQGEIMDNHPVSPYLFARGRARAERLRRNEAYGFKLLGIQLMDLFNGPDRRLVDRLASDGFVFIYLKRRNLLRQAISILRAVESGDWHPREQPDEPQGSIELDIPTLFFQMCQIEIQNKGLDWLLEPHKHLTLWYEDHLESTDRQQSTVDEVCLLLGLRTYPVSSDLQKTNDANGDVSNLEEVVRCVKQTRFGEFV